VTFSLEQTLPAPVTYRHSLLFQYPQVTCPYFGRTEVQIEPPWNVTPRPFVTPA